jgi:hypothetical protein
VQIRDSNFHCGTATLCSATPRILVTDSVYMIIVSYCAMLHNSALNVQSATVHAAAMAAAHREHMRLLEQAVHLLLLLLLLVSVLLLLHMIAAVAADGYSHDRSRTLN